MSKPKDYTGIRFGKLVALRPSENKYGSTRLWVFHCDCGKITERRPGKCTKTSSCGCSKWESLRKKNLVVGETDLETRFPEIASEWDVEKNYPLKPSEVTPFSTQKVWWNCPKGHSYFAAISGRTSNGNGCTYCAGKAVLKGYNDLETMAPEVAAEWDFTRNDLITPAEVTIRSSQKYYWKCKEGHSYLAAVCERTGHDSTGCPYCANRKLWVGFNDLKTRFPNISEEWDYDLNEKSPEDYVFGSGYKAHWKCKKGHKWETSIVERTNAGTNCPVCANKKLLVGYNDLATTHPYLVKEWDYVSNKKSPEDYIAGSHDNVSWICSLCGNRWKTIIKERAFGKTGCPKCKAYMHTSAPEQAVFYYVRQLFPDAINSYTATWLGKMSIDVFIPSKKIGIEYDGGLWHKDADRDSKKAELLADHEIQLIRLRESGSAAINDGSTIIPLQDSDDANVNEAIKKLICILGENHEKVQIDIEADRSEILAMYRSGMVANSVTATPYEIEWDYEKNGKLNPQNITARSHQKVWWKCEKCGQSWQQPLHTKKRLHCQHCNKSEANIRKSMEMISSGVAKALTDYSDAMLDWDYEKNSRDPKTLTHGSDKKVFWKCHNCGYEYEMTVRARLKRKIACKSCRNGCKSNQLTIQDFI